MTLLAIIAMVIRVVSLHRYAVKGLSGDLLDQVTFTEAGQCFPNDRRFALLEANKNFQGEWMHKENFLCAFTAPELLSRIQSSFIDDDEGELILKLKDRVSGNALCDDMDLSTVEGREQLGLLLSDYSGKHVKCVFSEDGKHQFGNTKSGVRERNDSRTVHLVNRASVQDLSRNIGIKLNPTRFRPNIVIDADPWSELDWVGKTLRTTNGLELSVISQTVRCEGISVDPMDPDRVLDIPSLLIEHFPKVGPYFGVYAVCTEPAILCTGDALTLSTT